MRRVWLIVAGIFLIFNCSCVNTASALKQHKMVEMDSLNKSKDCSADLKKLSEAKEGISHIKVELSQQKLTAAERKLLSVRLASEMSKQHMLELKTTGCLDKNAFYSLRIEQTQGVQVFDWDGPCVAFSVTPKDDEACRDNVIPMIDGKPTALRVYFDFPENMSWDLRNVDGEISFLGDDGVLVTIPSSNGPLERENIGGVVRAKTNNSLNFRIPGYQSTGEKDVNLTIYDANAPEQNIWSYSMVTKMNFQKIVIPVRGVMVRLLPYPGASYTVPQMGNRDDINVTIDKVRKFIPARLDVVGVDILDVDIPKETSGVSVNINSSTLWDIVATAVEREYRSSGRPAVYFGFYKSPAVAENTVGLEGGSECGRYGAFVTSAGSATTRLSEIAAHEFAHILNARHSDENPYPHVESANDLSIYSEGFDVEKMEVVSRNMSDVMKSVVPSNAWVSPFNYEIMRKCSLQSN